MDVRLSSFDRNKKIILSGAVFSVKYADGFVEKITKYLRVKGYKIKKRKLNY